ncbi:unnamed protein product, partial [Mesorhabditis spiculigera]
MQLQMDLDELLNKPHVRCRNREALEKKLLDVMADGPDDLMVISDFDYTLSRAYDDEGKCWSTLGVFDILADQVKPGLGKEIIGLWERYHPIEYDPHMTLAEKVPHMEDWWNKMHDLICSGPFTRSVIEDFVLQSRVKLRDGAEEWLLYLEECGIPLVVFSAGSGDVIEVHLKNQLAKIPDNVHIISNLIEYDVEGRLQRFSDPIIHVFNKNATVIQKNGPFWDAHSERKHILLMGDSLGDIHMDVGEVHKGHTIKIGFLNNYTEELYARFLQGFDLVVINDQSMTIPQALTEMIATGADVNL